MESYWITFRSLTHAQRAARLLERSGLTVTLVKAPQSLSENGCAYALTLRRPEEALSLLQRGKLRYGRVFRRSASESFEEVRL